MRKIFKYSILMPVVLLTACNFKFEYTLPKGVQFYSESGAWEDEESELDDSGTYNIKVWVDTKIQSLTEAQINNFYGASGNKIKFNATVQPMSEGEAATKMLQDVDAGADIFVFAQDQLSRLKTANAISALSDAMAIHMKDVNSKGSCEAATLADGKMYAYPMTSDNGYFLYYDKSVLSESDVKDMSTMLAKLKAKKKKLNFDRKNGFYSVSYFAATGCYSHWTTDKAGRFTDVSDNYNSENGVQAALAFREVCDNSVVATKSTWTNSAGAIITGIWEYDYIEEMFGKNNIACTELPSFKLADGTKKHMSSLDGYKLLGVKPQPKSEKKKASALRKLAEYLTNSENQLNRFRKVSWGPSNLVASENSEVLAHQGLNALKAQHAYAQQQELCPGDWFNALGGLCGQLATNTSEAQIRTLLANYQSGLEELKDD